MSFPTEEHIHTPLLYYCHVCHSILHLLEPEDFFKHIHEYTKQTFDPKLLSDIHCWKGFKGLRNMENWLLLEVYDLGLVLFEYSEQIKNLPLSILQTPFIPLPYHAVDTYLDFDIALVDCIYPSLSCGNHCQHSILFHRIGEDIQTWHKYKSLSKKEIKELIEYIPSFLKHHFDS
jgi:hypothetical protein